MADTYEKSKQGDYVDVNQNNILRMENLSAKQVDMLAKNEDIIMIEEDYIAVANGKAENVKKCMDSEWNIKMINADKVDKWG